MRVESIEDILRVLEAHPEWRLKLLQVLGMSELVYLPARLEAYQQENREQLEAFRQEFRERLEAYRQENQEQLEAFRQEFRERLEAYRQETREQIEALRQEFRERLEAYRQESRAQLEAYQQETRERFDRLENAVAQLMEGVAESRRVEQQLAAGLEESRRVESELRDAIEDLRQIQAKLLKDVAILKCSDRERYYCERAHAIFGRYLRKVQLLNMGDLLDEIEARTELSDEDADELTSADAIFYAVKKKTREPVYVVLEASWVVDEGDMERAIRRATILQRLGYPAVPVVAGAEVATPVIKAATEGSVVLALDGKVLGEALLK
ncbi:MAG: hypothetical protein K6U12_03540 [Armatimonadetes bacterium]|nr:hypothetical protein [Armatimonadota bacterium]CUU34164.1 hypothetical protein DCOP10_1067 [Armatimonadetes bacterium DC]